jgi:hypothetical protein
MTLIDVRGIRQRRQETLNQAALGVRALTAVPKDPAAFFYREALKGRWVKVDESARRRRKEQTTRIRALASRSEQLERALLLVPQLEVSRSFQFRDTITKSDLEARLVESGKNPELARYVFGRRRRRPVQLAALSPAAALLASKWTSALRRDALLSHTIAVAAFNGVHDGAQPIAEAVDVVRDVLGDISDAFRKGTPSDAAIAAEWQLLRVSEILATDAIPAAASAAAGHVASDSAAAEAAVSAANRIRELLWLAAVLKVVSWRCTWPTVGAADVLQKAANLQLRPRGARTRRIRVQDLVAGAAVDGAELELLGVVEAVHITHEGARKKPVTTFAIRDPDEDATVFARVFGFKADATGAVPGAAVVLTGNWKAGTGAHPGRLEVGRERISGDSQVSFLHHLRWAASSVYLPVPHGLRIQASWCRGANGPLNPVRFSVTARER